MIHTIGTRTFETPDRIPAMVFSRVMNALKDVQKDEISGMYKVIQILAKDISSGSPLDIGDEGDTSLTMGELGLFSPIVQSIIEKELSVVSPSGKEQSKKTTPKRKN